MPEARRSPANKWPEDYAEDMARVADLVGTDPPQYSRSFLVSRLAYRIQELAYGGLSASALADMDAIRDDAGCDRLGRIRRRRNGGPGHRKLLIGTRLAREWDGDRHEVTVVKGGFEYRGVDRQRVHP